MDTSPLHRRVTLVAAVSALSTLLCCTLLAAASPAGARVDPGAPTSSGAPTATLGAEPRVRDRTATPARGVWPLRPRPAVARSFERPRSLWGPGHRGADLAGHAGQPVRAALAGTVSFVGRIAGRGVVVVDHGATRTTYEPVLATARRGARVSRGQVVGRLAAVGSHCGVRACLHWGWRRGRAYLDPLRLVAAPRPVRLLPW